MGEWAMEEARWGIGRLVVVSCFPCLLLGKKPPAYNQIHINSYNLQGAIHARHGHVLCVHYHS